MPTVSSEMIINSPDMTVFRDTSDTGALTLRIVSKAPGTANLASLINASSGQVTTLQTARSLLQAGGPAWDNATPAQRSALMLTLVNVALALIRLNLGLLDQSS